MFPLPPNEAQPGIVRNQVFGAMPILPDPRLELFAVQYALALNAGVPASEAAEKAGLAAGYKIGRSQVTFGANCRKRAQRADIKRRITELREPGIFKAESAVAITTEYLLAKLDNLTNFNIDDFLLAKDAKGRRLFDVTKAPREVLARLSEMSQETFESKGKAKRTLLRTKIKGYNVIDGIRLMAQIKGLMAPEKRDLTIHATDQMTDDELARIAAGGSPGAAAETVSP
jgi:hypothetical protein